MSDTPLRASIMTWGWTLSVFLLASYLICIGFGLLAVPLYRFFRARNR